MDLSACRSLQECLEVTDVWWSSFTTTNKGHWSLPMMYYIMVLELFSAIAFQREKRHVSTTYSKRNYAQIDKDDLTAITEDKKFHNYIYSLFEIRTDCKTHLGILSNNKPAPSVMSPQMQRWSVMLSTTAMITALRQLFMTHLSPDTILSDNGTAFTSDESKDFTKSNLIRAVTIAPCHRQANDPSEQMVQTTKDAIMRIIKGDWLTRLARFLITQHITPCPSTRVSPAELLMEQCLKTWVHHLNHDLSEELEHKQDHALDSSLSSTLRFLHMTRKCICRSYGGRFLQQSLRSLVPSHIRSRLPMDKFGITTLTSWKAAHLRATLL